MAPPLIPSKLAAAQFQPADIDKIEPKADPRSSLMKEIVKEIKTWFPYAEFATKHYMKEETVKKLVAEVLPLFS